MGTLRRLAASLPIVKPAYRWLRETIDPHRRALRIARETQGDRLMQWSSATFADRYPPYFIALRQALAGVARPRILSFGCSTGEEVFTLRGYFPDAELTGIDINAHSIEVANRRLSKRENEGSGITFRCAGSLDEEPVDHYDAILAMAVLRHGELTRLRPESCAGYLPFATVERAVAGMVRCLKPGGLLMVSNSNYRVNDMDCAELLEVVHSDPLGLTQPDPIYGPDDRLRDDPANCEVIFRKKAGAAEA